MLIALYKPYGVLSQFTPEPGSRWSTLADFSLPRAVYPIGRLDADSEGLLLLSDEAAIVDRILSPEHKLPKEYWVQIEHIPSPEALERLRKGVRIGDYITLPAEVAVLPSPPDLPERKPPIRFRKNVPDSWISLRILEGKNRQVRRMSAAVGHPTLRLVRVAIGGLTLSNLGIGPGTWRRLEANERDRLFASKNPTGFPTR